MQALRRVGATALPVSSRLTATTTGSTSATASKSFISSFSTTSAAQSPSFSPSSSASHATTLSDKSASSGVNTGESIIPLSNIQAQWESMTEQERSLVHRQLEELQAKDWKSLSLDEKRAAYWVSFGPHGSRVPASQPGEGGKIALGILGAFAATGVLWALVRANGQEPPKTFTKEWQDASTERAKEHKMNPITGISSEGYQGKGFVQSK
ncbi:Cytochrome c oxidase subunit 5A [Serendipita sp. 398]|nr:Cytochrome c oxidase subunit 5A [Serendipita sp. 398]